MTNTIMVIKNVGMELLQETFHYSGGVTTIAYTAADHLKLEERRI